MDKMKAPLLINCLDLLLFYVLQKKMLVNFYSDRKQNNDSRYEFAFHHTYY